MGFERLCSILQNVRSNYDTDLFTPILARIAELAPNPAVQGYDEVRGDDEAEREKLNWDKVRDPVICAALGALGRYRRRAWNGPVVGVVGTNGKTSTKELTTAALASRVLSRGSAGGSVQARRYQSSVSRCGAAAASSTISESATDQRGA